MEQIIEAICPVSVGDKIYRTDSQCRVIQETIHTVTMTAKSCPEQVRGTTVIPTLNETVKFSFQTERNSYGISDLGNTIFLDKKELIQKLVNQL